jgi:hypothetical protein
MSGISWLLQESHGYVKNLMSFTEDLRACRALCFIPAWTPMISNSAAEAKGLVLQRCLSYWDQLRISLPSLLLLGNNAVT